MMPAASQPKAAREGPIHIALKPPLYIGIAE
jgi:hypothetical protein